MIRNYRALAATASTLLVVPTLSACGPNQSSTAAGSTTPYATTMHAVANPSRSGVTAAECLTPNLNLSAANGPNESPLASVIVTLTNEGAATCVLGGYAAVTLDISQQRIAADQNKIPWSTVTLAPGSSTSFAIWYSSVSAHPTYPNGTVLDMTVALPEESRLATLPWPGTGIILPQGLDSPASQDPIGTVVGPDTDHS